MKYLFWILIILVVVIFFYSYSQGSFDNKRKPIEQTKEFGGNVGEFTYKGHDYIRFSYGSGAGIVHDPECKKCNHKD